MANDPNDPNTVSGASSGGDDSLAEPGILAFQAVFVPAPASGPQRAFQGPRGTGDADGGWNLGRSGFRSTRDADPGLAAAVPLGQAGGASRTEPAAHVLSMAAPVFSSADALTAVPQGTNQRHAAAPLPADLSAWDAAEPANATKPAADVAAREIQLELRDADARVNVRLVERAGSVQVEVRTPDSHLAGSLRDDLPALTARLEQTGLRAETWHDAPAAAAARIRMAEPASNGGFQSSPNQSRREGGGRDPRDGQPQEKRQNQNQPESKEFSWLYTSLR
ncbi:MAG: hypothetical protein WBL61_21575 [Bryobacteraceae bacterium]